MDWIIDSPKCDKGTAYLIFWRAEPDYYYDYTAETIEDYQADVWHLLQKIVGRFKKDDFKSSKFEFIPAKGGGLEMKLDDKVKATTFTKTGGAEQILLETRNLIKYKVRELASVSWSERSKRGGLR